MAKLTAKVYGDALFSLALEENCLDAMFEEVLALKKCLEENQDLSKLMNHPKIVKEEKLQILENIFTDRISKDLLGFLNIIVEKDRYKELDSILEYFVDAAYEYKKIGKAQVVTATDLSEEQRKATESRLLETTSYEKMEVSYEVDESILGGMVIRIKDRVVDSSIRTKLNELTKELLKTKL